MYLSEDTALFLDCYWVGSLDFHFLGNQGVFHSTPQKVKLFAGGSTATVRFVLALATKLQAAQVGARAGEHLRQLLASLWSPKARVVHATGGGWKIC